jgi:hypothetical protein
MYNIKYSLKKRSTTMRPCKSCKNVKNAHFWLR